MNLKELFTAHYDVDRDEIRGCTPGTYIWYHELGHKRQFQNNFNQKIHAFLSLVINIASSLALMFFVIWLLMKFVHADEFLLNLATFCVLASVCVLAVYGLWHQYIEIDAHVFAIKKYFKRGDRK